MKVDGEDLGLRTIGDLFDSGRITMRAAPMIVGAIRLTQARSMLLAGREKSGKSSLTGQIAAAVSQGTPFLGEPTQAGQVLVFTLDEHVEDTARRLVALEGNPSVIVASETPSPSMLRKQLQFARPLLVVVDALSDLLLGRGVEDENDAGSVNRVLRETIRTCRDVNASLLVLHHARRADGGFRGSSAIAAAFDLLAEFRESETDSPSSASESAATTRRILHVRGRGIEPIRLRLSFDGQRYHRIDGTASFAARVSDVLAAGQMPIGALADRLGGNRSAVLKELDGLVAKGVVVEERGRQRARLLSLPACPPKAVPGGDSAHALTHEPAGREQSGSAVAPMGVDIWNHSISLSIEERNTSNNKTTGTTREPLSGTDCGVVPKSETHREATWNHSLPPAAEGLGAEAPEAHQGAFDGLLTEVQRQPTTRRKATSPPQQSATTKRAKPSLFPHWSNDDRIALARIWQGGLRPVAPHEMPNFVRAFGVWFLQPEAERSPEQPTNAEVAQALSEILIARKHSRWGGRLGEFRYASERVGHVVELIRDTGDTLERMEKIDRLLGLDNPRAFTGAGR